MDDRLSQYFKTISLFFRPLLAIGDNITDLLFITSLENEPNWFAIALTSFILPIIIYLFFIAWDPFELFDTPNKWLGDGKNCCDSLLNLNEGGSKVARICFCPIGSFYEALASHYSDEYNYEAYKFSLLFECILESLPQALIQTRIVTSLNQYTTIYIASFTFSVSTLAMDIGFIYRIISRFIFIGTFVRDRGRSMTFFAKVYGFCMTISEISIFCMLIFSLTYSSDNLYLSVPFIIIFVFERFIRSYFFSKDHLGHGRALDKFKIEQIFGFIFSLFSHGYINHVERGGTTARDFDSPRHWYMSGLGYLRALVGMGLGFFVFFLAENLSKNVIFFFVLSIGQMVSTLTCFTIFLIVGQSIQ